MAKKYKKGRVIKTDWKEYAVITKVTKQDIFFEEICNIKHKNMWYGMFRLKTIHDKNCKVFNKEQSEWFKILYGH